MPITNYKNMFYEISQSRFLKIQVIVLYIITYIDWVILPFVTKLEGTYLPVYMISIYMLIGALDGFIQPLFKHTKLYNIYLFAIMLDIIQIMSYMFYQWSAVVFTYVILSIFTIQGITFEIVRVHTVDFMQGESVELKDYLMIRSFIISLAILCGGLSAILFDYFGMDLKWLFYYLSFLGLIGIMLQFILYKKFKKRIQISDIEIQKDRREIFEKIRG